MGPEKPRPATAAGSSVVTSAAFAHLEEWRELLMPLVQSPPASLTLATIRPPGHMQNE